MAARVTDRDFEFLKMLATAYLMTPREITERNCYSLPKEEDAKRTRRKRTAALTKARYINRYPRKHEADRRPTFYLAKKGTEELARRLENLEILAKPTKLLCNPAHIGHSVAVGQFLLDLSATFDTRPDLQFSQAYHEFEPVNPAAESKKRFRFYSILSESPKIICMPDAGFLLHRGNDRVPYYVEYETGFNGFKEAAKKAIGYRELAAKRRHMAHFPEATTEQFLVLMICPKDRYRDQVAKLLPSLDPEGHQFWRLVTITDATPDRLLTQPVIRRTTSAELQLLVQPA